MARQLGSISIGKISLIYGEVALEKERFIPVIAFNPAGVGMETTAFCPIVTPVPLDSLIASCSRPTSYQILL